MTLETPSLPDLIRAAIAPAHTAVEQTPFARAMITGTITRADYVVGLAQLGILHRELEAATEAAVGLPAALIPPPRTPAIERDLLALGGDASDAAHPAIADIAQRFHDWAAESPTALLGAIYVLEGSRMGSMVLARSLTRALHVQPQPNRGLDYHIDGIATRPTDWKAFRNRLAEADFSAESQEQIVAAAVEVMDALTTLYSAVPVDATASEAQRLEAVAV